jgi:ADP-heptose:LPS heptosyltransferase
MALLDEVPRGSRIAVIRLRSLGDCVLTTPALCLLKNHRPDLEIGVVVEDRFAGVFEGLDEVTCILPPRRRKLFAWRPRAVLNLHGGTRSMSLVAASGARVRAGFAHHKGSFLYNFKIPRAQEILGEERPVHTAEHLASAVFWMGAPRVEIPRAKLNAKPLKREPYAVIHPFASRADKAWPGFADVARHLRSHGLTPVIVAGPEDDTAPFADFEVWRNAPLAQVKSILAGASLFVGNDSGPAHTAAAFGVPVAALFGPSNPSTWSPWKTESQVLTSSGPISSISTAQVLSAIETLRVSV